MAHETKTANPVKSSLALLAATPAQAAVNVNVSEDFTGFAVFVSCANHGAGELVVFTGNLHILFTTTFDAKGGVHFSTHFQPQGLRGIGVVTGDSYQATGVTQDHFNGKIGQTFTAVNNFRIIGTGPGNNYLVHSVDHYTVNANGTVTAVHDSLSSECK